MEHQTWIGRSLNGRYTIEALLGQGGMSAVYKAMDPNLRRVVAVKLIHQHLSTDEEFVYRFKREATAVAAFRHPNIVQVFDFNNDNDVYYMVMEFIPGETLQDRLKHLKESNRKMPFDQAVRIILNICDALGYAHKQGMIHRDIKPANIMLDVHGQAILMDFGIVKILDSTAHTTTGAYLGTARYMSPEVIRSEVPDERSDLYSLGVTFYEMLSGDPPFDGNSAMSLLMRHLNDPVPDLSTKRPDIPVELIRIVNKALEKDRDNRYRTANEMAADLKRFLAMLEAASATPAGAQANIASTETMLSPERISNRVETKTEARDETRSAAPAQHESHKREPVQTGTTPARKSRFPSLATFGLIGIGLLLCIAVAGFSLLRIAFPTKPDNQSNVATQTVEAEMTAVSLSAAQQTLEAQQAVLTVTSTPTPLPTDIPTETPVPPTPTLSTPYVLITGIWIENNKYIVDYEVYNFPESPSLHVHMFFDTVPPEQAGMPGSGPWKLTWGAYGNPPFTQYGPSNRPVQATRMCALVANPNHSVQLNTGNCVDLPQ